jgi:hypothetical protein
MPSPGGGGGGKMMGSGPGSGSGGGKMIGGGPGRTFAGTILYKISANKFFACKLNGGNLVTAKLNSTECTDVENLKGGWYNTSDCI